MSKHDGLAPYERGDRQFSFSPKVFHWHAKGALRVMVPLSVEDCENPVKGLHRRLQGLRDHD